MRRLEQRIALVTGAASGFGAGIARRLAAEGAFVAVLDHDEGGASDIAKGIGPAAAAFTADVTSATQIDVACSRIEQRFGCSIDILVNNVGIGQRPTPLEEVDDADFDRLFAVNAKSVFLTAKRLIPAMKSRRSGVILNIASTGAVRPRPNLTWYNATKGWMVTATKGMAIELAPFGIRVNAINPVAGDTPLLETFMGENSVEARAQMVNSIPLGRLSTPVDIAAAAAFLCSDDAAMVSGVALEVDGGRCI